MAESPGRRTGMRVPRALHTLLIVCVAAGTMRANAAGAKDTRHPAPPAMGPEEIKTFLAQPLVAHLATVRRSGSPQVVPMWFLYDNGVVYMSTRTWAAKVRHIRHNPHVAVEVDVMQAPLKNKVVGIDGTAEIVTTGVTEMTARIYHKYMGAAAAASPAAQQGINTPRVILKITPKKMWSMNTAR